MKYPHWNYFLSLEKDFINTIRYVEIDDNNSGTSSVEYTKLLLSACSEIDVVCKLLCKKVDPESNANNIDEYKAILLGKYPNIYKIEIQIPRYEELIKPWASWETNINPDWWRSYNKVKHQRDIYAGEANQANTIMSLAGLFGLLLYYYQPEFYKQDLSPLPDLFEYENMPGYLIVNTVVELPDFPRASSRKDS